MTEKLQLEVEIIPNMSAVNAELKKPRSITTGAPAASGSMGMFDTPKGTRKLLGDMQAGFKTAAPKVSMDKLFSTLGRDKETKGSKSSTGLLSIMLISLKSIFSVMTLVKVGIGVIAAVLLTLGPVVAILKGIFALLQITLRPIAFILLGLFKTIFVLMLRWLIIPVYKWLQKMGVVKESKLVDQLEKAFGGMKTGGVIADKDMPQLEYINEISPIIADFIIFGQWLGSLIGIDVIGWAQWLGDWFRSLPAHFDIEARKLIDWFGSIYEEFLREGGLVVGWFSGILREFELAGNGVRDWFNSIPAYFDIAKFAIGEWWAGLPKWFDEQITAIGEWWESLPKWFDEQMTGLLNIGAGIKTFMLDQLNGLLGIGTAIKNYIMDKIGMGNASGKAAGGPVTGGTPYIVGENGPELFMPGTSGTIIPNNKLGGTSGGSGVGGITLNITGNSFGQRSDIDYMVNEIEKKLYRNGKLSGNW